MSKSLFTELKNIGIDEDIAVKVSASLDPDYNASKKDILVMQEALMQMQIQTDTRYHDLNNKIEFVSHDLNTKIESVSHELNTKIESVNHALNNKIESVEHVLHTEMHQGFASLRSEIANMNRQYLITFGGLISTIIFVFLINLYFHL